MFKENQENSIKKHRAIVSDKINESSQYQKIYRKGKSYASKELIMYILKNDTDTNRFGIAVSKKVGNSVVRHRVTRLIRETYRLNGTKLKTGYDIVVVARANAKGKNYFDICRSFLYLAGLHGIFREE